MSELIAFQWRSAGPCPPYLIGLSGPFLLFSLLRAPVVAARDPAAFTEEAVMAQFDLEKQALVGAGGLLSVRADDEITRKLSMAVSNFNRNRREGFPRRKPQRESESRGTRGGGC